MANPSVTRLIQVGKQYQSSGKPALAESSYRAAIEYDPTHLDAVYLLTTLLSQTGKLDEAIETTQRAVAALPAQHFLHFHLGNLLLSCARPACRRHGRI